MSDQQIDLDTVDYAIMSCLSRCDQPLWKKGVYDQLHHDEHSYPGDMTSSLQTVSRHMDTLHNHGHISSVIINPADLDRELIIGYQLTDTGNAALHRKREELLRLCLPGLFSDDHIPFSKPVLVQLIAEHYDLSDEARTTVTKEYSRQDIVFVAVLHQLQQFADTHLSSEHTTELMNAAGINTDLSSLLSSD